jgi:hypothetical protein
LATQLLSEFVFRRATLNLGIFDHRTINVATTMILGWLCIFKNGINYKNSYLIHFKYEKYDPVPSFFSRNYNLSVGPMFRAVCILSVPISIA